MILPEHLKILENIISGFLCIYAGLLFILVIVFATVALLIIICTSFCSYQNRKEEKKQKS